MERIKSKKTSTEIHKLVFGLNYDNSEAEIADFEHHLKISILEEQIKILGAIEKNELTEKEIFLRKADFLSELKDEKAAEEKKELESKRPGN